MSGTGHSAGGRRLQDHLLFHDRARSQKGILQADIATIYRNVEAELYRKQHHHLHLAGRPDRLRPTRHYERIRG